MEHVHQGERMSDDIEMVAQQVKKRKCYLPDGDINNTEKSLISEGDKWKWTEQSGYISGNLSQIPSFVHLLEA